MPSWEKLRPIHRLIATFAMSALVAVGMFAVRLTYTGSTRYWFLVWNLALAWLPMLLAWLLVRTLHTHRWLSWRPLVLTLLWVGFLPNSFYLVSDLIHLHASGEISLLYDAAMFCMFIFNGFIYGFVSLLIVHRELLRRFTVKAAHSVIAGVLFLCSFAIYLGRYMRWNTWDVLINPAGLIVDLSDRVVNPRAHEETFAITIMFFVLLSAMYVVIWQTVRFLRAHRPL